MALYHRLRDLFSLKPDLVLYDITSTYFEGAGPHDFAKHGYSRDGKSQNVQVIVGMVMVAGWPIAHHVWAGNRIDHSTVQEVIRTCANASSSAGSSSSATGAWSPTRTSSQSQKMSMDSSSGSSGGATPSSTPGSTRWTTRSGSTVPAASIPGNERPTRRAPVLRKSPPGDPDLRVIVIDSDERRGYEQAKREQAMERARQKLEKLKERVAAGDLKRPEKIGAAVERVMQKYHGYRYFDWKLKGGALEFSESETRLGREKKIEGKYVIMTSEKGLSVLDAVAMYKELTEVESGFRQLKDVMAMRPIYHQIEVAGEGPHLRGGAGVAGATTAGPAAQGGGGGSVAGAGDASIVDGAVGELPPGGPTGAPRGDRRLSRCPAGAEGTEARRPATAGAARGGGDCDVVTNRKSGPCAARGYVRVTPNMG